MEDRRPQCLNSWKLSDRRVLPWKQRTSLEQAKHQEKGPVHRRDLVCGKAGVGARQAGGGREAGTPLCREISSRGGGLQAGGLTTPGSQGQIAQENQTHTVWGGHSRAAGRGLHASGVHLQTLREPRGPAAESQKPRPPNHVHDNLSAGGGPSCLQKVVIFSLSVGSRPSSFLLSPWGTD